MECEEVGRWGSGWTGLLETKLRSGELKRKSLGGKGKKCLREKGRGRRAGEGA